MSATMPSAVFSSVPWHAWLNWAELPDAVQDDIRALCKE